MEPTISEELATGMLKIYSDGSIARITEDPSLNVPPSEQPLGEDGGVASRDISFQQHSNNNVHLWARLYLPPRRHAPLPILVYFHGGGFCLIGPSFIPLHRFCLEWSAAVGAIMVSVNYRLAPEHRLPAAYEDSMAAVQWIRSQSINGDKRDADPWLKSFADFSNVYLMGDSAGANIVHRLITNCDWKDWRPLEIRGAILLQPFFGGQQRTLSEINCPESALLNLKACDEFWRMALPIGATRDHPFSNPFARESPRDLSEAVVPPLLVAVGGKDILKDRDLEYCETLKKNGKPIELIVFEEEEHGFYAHKLDSEISNTLKRRAALFVYSNSSAASCVAEGSYTVPAFLPCS